MRTIDTGSGVQYVVRLDGPAPKPGQWRPRTYYLHGEWVLVKQVGAGDPGPSVAGLYEFKPDRSCHGDVSEHLDSWSWSPTRRVAGLIGHDEPYQEWRH